MHLVFLNQYYPPDAAPTGVMLAAVAEHLAAQGHEVTVICAEGGYADGVASKGLKVEGLKVGDVVAVRVLRIRATRFGRGTFVGKVVDYLSYYMGVSWKLMFLQPRPERIVALTTPPYLSVLARVLSKMRGGDHAHWVMDLYPDVMVAHGMLREGGVAHRFLAGLARWGFGGKRCAALLTLGPDMAERIAALVGTDFHIGPTCFQRNETQMKSDPGPAARDEVGRPRPSDPTGDEVGRMRKSAPTGDEVGHLRKGATAWIPLWSDADGERRSSKDGDEDGAEEGMALAKRRHERGWRDDDLVVMYSGNMGLGHRFGEILEVIGKKAGGPRTEDGGRRAEGGGRRSEVGADGLDRPTCCHRRAEEEDPAIAGPAARDEVGRPRPVVPTRFVFFGGGKRRGEIERFVAAHPEAAVELHDYAPAEDLGIHLRSADVHLASLAAEWTGTMVPSKLQGIFHAARPVIFIGDADSSIGRWVAGSGGGWVVAPGDVVALRRALEEAREPDARESRGRAAKVFAEANFDKATNVRRVAEILSQ